ncbi:3-phytase, partial [Klebsormidium nitens]
NPQPPNLQTLIALALFAVGLLTGALLRRASLAVDRRSAELTSPLDWTRARDLPLTSALAGQPRGDTCPPQLPCDCACGSQPCDASIVVCPPCDCVACATCPPCAPCDRKGVTVNECMIRNRTLMEGSGVYAKRMGLPAAERVNGMLIEELQPHLHFRPGYAYGQTDDVEDPSHLIPWLLGNQVDLKSASRRVFLNLGANAFDTSTAWFMRTYPVNFDEIHAFEITGAFVPPRAALARLPHPPNVTLYAAIVGARDFPASGHGLPGIDIVRFINEELNIKAEDTFIVKMDIEGAEWEVLPAVLQNACALAVIDELFVEIHYGDPAMAGCGWDQFYPRRIEDALALARALRAAGLRTHLWP